jgi:hypothetical protein
MDIMDINESAETFGSGNENLKQLLANRKYPEGEDKQLRPFGLCAGEFCTPDDFDVTLPEEILNAFEFKILSNQ